MLVASRQWQRWFWYQNNVKQTLYLLISAAESGPLSESVFLAASAEAAISKPQLQRDTDGEGQHQGSTMLSRNPGNDSRKLWTTTRKDIAGNHENDDAGPASGSNPRREPNTDEQWEQDEGEARMKRLSVSSRRVSFFVRFNS
jgi:hypothetical protein